MLISETLESFKPTETSTKTDIPVSLNMDGVVVASSLDIAGLDPALLFPVDDKG